MPSGTSSYLLTKITINEHELRENINEHKK
jgi:hypothetical protein